MEEIKSLSREKLEELISTKDIRQTQIITIALNMGVFLFFGVCFVLYQAKDIVNEASVENHQFLDTLLIISLAVMIVNIFASKYIPEFVLKKAKESKPLKSVKAMLIGYMETITKYFIIKFALLEGAALLGLVVLFSYTMQIGRIDGDIYWLGVLPMLMMFTISYLNFPTKERIIQLINEKILTQLN